MRLHGSVQCPLAPLPPPCERWLPGTDGRSALTELNKQGRYDRMTDAMCKPTGEAPTGNFVKLHAAEFKQHGSAHS